MEKLLGYIASACFITLAILGFLACEEAISKGLGNTLNFISFMIGFILLLAVVIVIGLFINYFDKNNNKQ